MRNALSDSRLAAACKNLTSIHLGDRAIRPPRQAQHGMRNALSDSRLAAACKNLTSIHLADR
ncbi:MAG: hypothetical protein OXI55_12550, partial [Gammaproteobacteria bacterium]|nr:hypothetical protein [Gammaproteobacteria bacterium]